MLHPASLTFLKSLQKNNNRTWFEKNREKYETAREDFANFINGLIAEIAKHHPEVKGLEAKNCMFRIYRDIRFSKDKTPYKTHFSAQVGVEGRKSEMADFYIQIGPGNSFIAGGKWHPETAALKDIRQEIFYNTADFKKILSEKSFKKHFKTLSDIKLKTVPKGYDKNFPDIELLKYTSYIVEAPIADKLLLSRSLVKHAAAIHKAMLPLLNFLNAAAHH